jgi:hypothetical protein
LADRVKKAKYRVTYAKKMVSEAKDLLDKSEREHMAAVKLYLKNEKEFQ